MYSCCFYFKLEFQRALVLFALDCMCLSNKSLNEKKKTVCFYSVQNYVIFSTKYSKTNSFIIFLFFFKPSQKEEIFFVEECTDLRENFFFHQGN